MLHILYGPDSFSRAEALAAIKQSLDTDGMLVSNTNVLEGKTLTAQHLQMVCGAAPFLAASRLVVVEGLLARLSGRTGGGRARRAPGGAVKLPEDWASLPEMVAAMAPTTTLVLTDGDLPAGSPALEALAEHGRARNFPKIPAKPLEEWIARRAKTARVTLEPEALRLFAASITQETDGDGEWHALWGVVNDLEKLSLYAGSRPVTAEEVRRLVPASMDTNIFAYVDAVVERRAGEALRRLQDLLFAGQPGPVLLTMLARGYRQILLYVDLSATGARQDEIGRRLNLQRWQLDRVGRQASHYQMPRLTAIYERILQADRSIKRGETDEATALELLTAELAAAG